MGMMACYMEADMEKIQLFKSMDEDGLFEQVEELGESGEWETFDLDKLWDGIHFLLTGASADLPIYGNVMSEAIVGEKKFIDEEDTDYIAYICPEHLKEIVTALEQLDLREIGKRYNPKEFAKNGIYPNIWMKESEENVRKELEENLSGLVEFYKRCSNNENGVVVSIY